jgi:hypothetical protein
MPPPARSRYPSPRGEGFGTASRAFPSEIDLAFSSEADTGSREENASKQQSGASHLIQSEATL